MKMKNHPRNKIKIKKILLFCGSHDGTPEEGAEFTVRLVKKLQEKGIQTVLVTYFKEQKIALHKKGLFCTYVPKEKEIFSVKNVTEELRELEIEYDFCAERILMGDPDYSDSVSRKKAFLDMVKYFKFWEVFLDLEKPELVFGGDNRFGNLVPYYVCKKKKIIYEVIYSSPIVPNSFFISKDKEGRLTEMEEYWNKNKNQPLSKKESNSVKKYLHSVRSDQSSETKVIDTSPKINLNKIKYALERSIKYLQVEGKDTPYLRPWRGIKNYLLRIIRAPISKIYYEMPRSHEKFIFFPLQVHLETTLLISNHQFFHQERLIETISKNLPAGYWLYVKGHPGYIGGHELSLFKAIKKLPNVRIIHPLINSRKLIKEAAAVAVIFGTTGWEALLLKKPVITFGITYYDNSGLTYKVDDLGKTSEVINEALKENPKQKELGEEKEEKEKNKKNEETLLRFVNSYFQTTYKGKIAFTGIYHANASNRELVLKEENLDTVVNSIIKHLKKEL